MMQSVDQGIHLVTDSMKASSGQQVNLILILQFKYVKIIPI